MRRRTVRPTRSASCPASAGFLSGLIDRAPDVVFRVRLAPRPRLEYVNPAVLALTGYAPADWYADPGLVLRLIHPADRRKLQEAWRSRRLPGRPVVLRWTRRDGTPLRTEIAGTAVRGRHGTLAAIEGIAREVTAARGNGEAGRGDDRFLRAAFDQVPVGLAHITADGRFLHVNRRLCDMTGFSADELLRRHMRDIAHPDDVERDAALLQQLRSNDAAQATIEKRVVSRDGTLIRVRVAASRLRNAGACESVAVLDELPPPVAQEADQRRLACDGGIELDTDRLEVTWNGRRVPLTLKEVLLLRYLIRHRGETLARDRLLRDVWGYEHAGRSRTLDVHVCRLRRKLPPLADSLVTIGHLGYTLAQGMGSAPMPLATR